MSAVSTASDSRASEASTGLRPARGAVTFFVLLLLVGAAPTGDALNWMATGAIQRAAAPAVVRQVHTERPEVAPVVTDNGLRLVARRAAPVRLVVDALLPPARAPDCGRVA